MLLPSLESILLNPILLDFVYKIILKLIDKWCATQPTPQCAICHDDVQTKDEKLCPYCKHGIKELFHRKK